jgi:5-methylcytosine-specific restriction endonuclease McrA
VTRPAVEPVAFAEKVLALLELGSFAATYKYALFTAIMDLCLEQSSPSGTHPTTLTTRQLAEKVIDLYWQHVTPYEGGAILRQGGVRAGNQAEILKAISGHRSRYAASGGASLFRARLDHREAFEKLVDEIEWKLIEMPIPRLQVIGREEDRFLYEYAWGKEIRRSEVAAYQRGVAGAAFDNLLRLKPGVVEAIKSVSGILRPLVYREWAMMVASMNGLSESKLEGFLFGLNRVQLDAVRTPLRDLHGGYCFYCAERMSSGMEVDHFIPWARYADNGLDNLVPSHPRCNNQKRDFIAAESHLEKWATRMRDREGDLSAIAESVKWIRDRKRSEAVAKSIYLRLPDGARLWLSGSNLVRGDRGRITETFKILGGE